MINANNITITDPGLSQKRNLKQVDRFFLNLIRDERDLPFIYLTIQITLIMIPMGISLYFITGWAWWIIAVGYLYLNNLYFKGPFGLMLHCTSHRPFFKKDYQLLNYYLPWVVAPFFGHTPETYFVHHIGMHHVENNLEHDESSTMPFKRDSFKSFLNYFGVFFFKGVFELYQYHKKRNRQNFINRMVNGEVSYFFVIIFLSVINFPATLVAFIIPF